MTDVETGDLMTRQPKPAPRPRGPTFEQRIKERSFAQRLQEAMDAKEMKPSDVARRMFGDIVDAKGYKVAKGRDRLSMWLSGKAIPDKDNLRLLAEKLDVPEDDLLPERAASRNPRASMVDAGDGKMYLQISRVVDTVLAAKIMLMIAEYESAAQGENDK